MNRPIVLKSMLTCSLALFVVLFAGVSSAAEGTRYLGSTKLAHHENDLDVIRTRCKPRINAIKLKAKKGQVEVERLWVRFGDGSTDTLHIRDRIRQGGESRWVDLNGGKRCVVEVGVIGDTERSLDRARVDVYGRY